jgi:hypothetical protein
MLKQPKTRFMLPPYNHQVDFDIESSQ